MTLILPLLISNGSWGSSLPECEGSPETGERLGHVLYNWKYCHGSFTFRNGNKYIGEYGNGTRDGQGTFIWTDGRKYIGEWRDGGMYGMGEVTWANGNQYNGEFHGNIDKMLLEYGTLTYPDGSEYTGEFKDMKKHGKGIYSFKGFLGLNKKQEGIWKEDEFLYKSNVSLISDEDREFCLEIGFEPNTREYDNCLQKSAEKD